LPQSLNASVANQGHQGYGDGREQPGEIEVVADDGHAEEGGSATGTGLLLTVFLIINAALGAGLLNVPRAFLMAGGTIPAVSVQTVLLAFILGALLILAHCADKNLSRTMQDAVESACGPWGRRFTSLCVALYCFGTTLTFVIIVGDQFDRAFASLYGHEFCRTWYLSRDLTMPVSCVFFVLPLCFSKRIDFLKIPSALGVLAIFYIVGLIVYEYLYPMHKIVTLASQSQNESVPWTAVYNGLATTSNVSSSHRPWTDLFRVVPVICFGYQCHVSVIPIYSCMRRPTKARFSAVSFSAVSACAAAYTLTGALGLAVFGDQVEADVLLNFSAKRPEVMVALAAMALKTFTTYPILLFCGREALVSLLEECRRALRGR